MFGLSDSGIFWVAVVIIVVAPMIFNLFADRERNRTIRALAEKGLTIPPELLRGSSMRRRDRSSPLRSGLILICAGIGISVLMWAMTSSGNTHFYGPMGEMTGSRNWLPFVGVIPFMVGIAMLLSAAFERRRPDDQD